MLLRRVTIRNIKSIAALDWKPTDASAGWNVILGNNGSGKSTFLRSISLALIGPREIQGARIQWKTWLPPGENEGEVSVEVIPDEKIDQVSRQGRKGETKVVMAGVTLRVEDDGSVEPVKSTGIKTLGPERHIWGTGAGWFSAGYGPFRRFAGGDKDAERTYLSNPSLGAHISIFGENAALSESLFWLRELNYRRLEGSAQETELLDTLKVFVNQPGFLPHEVSLKEVSSRGVEFEDAKGSTVSVEDLSDGYRSILSMTFELIRQLVGVFSISDVFDDAKTTIVPPGVVLIDEIDAHLHPTWQKEVGFWLTKHFPYIQFIVTTHSPLVCHAAVRGSIYQLPSPESLDVGRFIEGPELNRLLYGDVLDGLSTPAFDMPETRSEEAQLMQRQLADMNVQAMDGTLSDIRRPEQERLRNKLLFFDIAAS